MSQIRRVLIITGEYHPQGTGGRAISCRLLVENLRNKGVDVKVILLRSESTGKNSNTKNDILCVPMNESILPDKYVKFLKILNSIKNEMLKFDIIHFYTAYLTSPLLFSVILNKVKLPGSVATLYENYPACINHLRYSKKKCNKCNTLNLTICVNRKLLQKKFWILSSLSLPISIYIELERSMYKFIRLFFALSEKTKELYSSAGFPKNRIIVSYNMYDPIFLNNVIKLSKLVNKERERKIVLYVGRLEPEKGVDVLIRSFSKIKDRNTLLWIVGTGSQINRLQKLVKRINIKDRVRFFGKVEYSKLPLIYLKSNIFVHPARWSEPFGRTIIEAALSRLPIISSNVGAPFEIMKDSILTYSFENEEDLAHAIEQILDDSELAESLSERAYEIVLENFSPEKVIGRIIYGYNLALTKTSLG